MLHSGLSKSQPLPLLAAASSPRRALLAGLLHAGHFSKSAASPVLRPTTTTTTTTRASTRAATTRGVPSCFGLGPRVSFSTAPDASDSVGGGRALPWLAAANVDSGVPSTRTSAGRSASWERSAGKFFSRGDQSARRDALEDRVSYKAEGIREEENGPSDNRKWDMIKDAAGVDNGVPSKRTSGGRSSSWERSAGKFFSRGDQSARRDALEDRVSCKEEGTREEENEPIDNPKWGSIKDKFRRNVARDGGSRGRGERFRGERFDRPDVRRWNKQEDWGRKTWKEAGESTVPKMVGEAVYGAGPVLAALMAGRREFYALYTREGMDLSGSNKKKKDKKAIEKVLRMAESIGLKVIEASKHDLNMVVDSRPHQGLVLDASPLEMVNTKELEPVRVDGGKVPVWIALDEVMDPQNLGAIIRSAYFFGAEGVVLCAKNSAPLSGVVSKASAGSLELIELLSCRNMMQFLSSSAENGWRVLGGTVAPKAIPLSEVTTGQPTILVLGSEGTGLRPLVERSCTHLVKISGNVDGFVVAADADADTEEDDDDYSDNQDMTNYSDNQDMNNYSDNQDMKSFLAVESLNVSVAAGVLLYHLVGKNACPVSDKPSISLM